MCTRMNACSRFFFLISDLFEYSVYGVEESFSMVVLAHLIQINFYEDESIKTNKNDKVKN